jgi:RimJ/RimL family protein N-acetyltransferase
VRTHNREQVEEFYENTITANDGDSNFVICVDGEPIGEANLFGIERDHGEIAYWIDSDWRGEGYATEAVSLLLTHAFDTRGLHRVVARIGDFNDGSQALVERLGFEREGRLREHMFVRGTYHDTLLYGHLRDEWNPEFELHQ